MLVAGVADGAAGSQADCRRCKKRLPKVDETRVYLAGAARVPGSVYTVSRTPDLWAAALAIQGSPGRLSIPYKLYGANAPLPCSGRSAAEVDMLA
jgi:hypothetical protein